jgi:hypothetical protein
LEARPDYIIQLRHGVIHKLALDSGLTKQQILDILDTALTIIETFVDFLERERGKLIRDETLEAGVTAAAPGVSAESSGQRRNTPTN